ncbi:MAG: CRISPR-associated protein [Leptolyngbya sp. SIO4C1]|nr:CRISPR-associated protein [Leptolyngbya sp. SIO4C1]
MKRPQLVESITDFSKNFLASFIIGTLVFTIISDGVSALFWEVFGSQLQAYLNGRYGWNLSYNQLRGVMVLLLLGMLLLLVYLTNFARWVWRWVGRLPFLKVPVQANVERLTTTYPGLIVAMSPKEDSPAEAVIRFHWNDGQATNLKHCWVLCTAKSLPYATRMVQRLADQGVTQAVKFHYGSYALPNVEELETPPNLLIPDEQIDDPNYIQGLVDCIYADAAVKGLDESDVIADYTGATKGMTAGILLACARPERPLQYISQLDCSVMAVRVSYKLKQAQ